jgi:hypothetical protein
VSFGGASQWRSTSRSGGTGELRLTARAAAADRKGNARLAGLLFASSAYSGVAYSVAVPDNEPALLVPLRSNSNALLGGAPVESVRRRLKFASISFRQILLEVGIYRLQPVLPVLRHRPPRPGRVRAGLHRPGRGGQPVRRPGHVRRAERRADRTHRAGDGPQQAGPVPARAAGLPGHPGHPLVPGPGRPPGLATRTSGCGPWTRPEWASTPKVFS